jgi:luciferase-like monooxygenase
MQFGLNFFPCVGPNEKSAEQYFREAMHLCSLTDGLGYTHIRQVEHYFHPYGGYSPNPLLFLTAAAMITKKTRLITGAVLPAFNKPLKLAGEIGMLDGISNGRLEVGFARAFLPHEFTQFGVSLDESRRRFTEGKGFLQGRVQQLQQRHLVAAADAEAAPAVLDRRDQHAGDLRVRRDQRLQGDGDPARAGEDAKPDRHLS